MADLFSTFAGIVASYLPSAMFYLGCFVAGLGTGFLVLRSLDALTMYLIQSGPAYADLFRFLRWRWGTPDKSIDPMAMYKAAKHLYYRARWVCNNMDPDEQTALWTALRDALRIPEGTASALGLGAAGDKATYMCETAAETLDPELLLARISYCNAQCSEDAVQMRSMAMDYFRHKRDRMMHVAQPGLIPLEEDVLQGTA